MNDVQWVELKQVLEEAEVSFTIKQAPECRTDGALKLVIDKYARNEVIATNVNTSRVEGIFSPPYSIQVGQRVCFSEGDVFEVTAIWENGPRWLFILEKLKETES